MVFIFRLRRGVYKIRHAVKSGCRPTCLIRGFQGRTQDFRRGGPRGGGPRGGEGGGREEGGGARGGGGGPKSAKEANMPNKRATGLKPRTCTHQGSMFRP